jgi:enoyl-CoA hydratase
METSPRFHKVEKDGPIIIWKFDNPPRNLATIDTMNELTGLVEEFDKDAELRVGIVTSATPGKFIQHFDVSLILEWAEQFKNLSEDEAAQILATLPPPRGITDHTSKPVICAINGPVEGGGCEMALACDFRFGRRITPDEAESLGLVVAVCEPNELMPTVMDFARDLAAKPPLAVSLVKKAIYEGSNMSMPDGLMFERKLFFDALRSEDAINIMRLYVEMGQGREKLEALVVAVGTDPEKITELLTSEKD